ncbi:MAG: hypothetical protein KC912_14525 [Proteobacteria bacterium]|nr:hypothetical protein [Pseudomonadota bacterium]
MTKLPLLILLAIGCGATGGPTNDAPSDSASSDSGTDSGGDDSGSTDSGSGDSGSTDSGSGDSGNTDSGGTDTGGTDTGNPGDPEYCYEGCVTASDCATSSAAYDADNYECTATGACKYTGCNSTSECQASLTADYVCLDRGGVSSCIPGCNTASDCGFASAGVLYDSDHYACRGGGCDWTGCQSTADCTATLGAGYACTDLNGLPTCLETCTTPSDCGTTSLAFDADNYACTAGTCRYEGCNTDTECVDALGSGAQCE